MSGGDNAILYEHGGRVARH